MEPHPQPVDSASRWTHSEVSEALAWFLLIQIPEPQAIQTAAPLQIETQTP